jgi:CheY-like chemotaxis protein
MMHGRQKQRVLVQKSVKINGNIDATCFDLNEEGMYIQTDTKVAASSVVNLDFEIDGRPIRVKASVRHLDEGFGFGVRFINLPLQDKIVIREMLHLDGQMSQDLKTILIVDGNDQSRTIYNYILQQEGFRVIETRNGNDAFKILQQTRPDFVVIDNKIGGINAFKVLQFMQTRDDLKDVPSIMITTRFIAQESEKTLSLGVRDYLVKSSTSPKVLVEKIRNILGE